MTFRQSYSKQERWKTGHVKGWFQAGKNENWFSARSPHMGAKKKLVARILKSEPLISKSKPLFFCPLKNPFENSLKNADVFRLTYSAPGGHGIFHFRAAGVCRYSCRICGRRVKSNARHIVPCRALFVIFSRRFPPKPCRAVPGSRSVLFAGLQRCRRRASYFLSSSLLNSSSVTLLCSSVIMPL